MASRVLPEQMHACDLAEEATASTMFLSEAGGFVNKKDRDLICAQMRDILSDELSKPADKIAAAKMLRSLDMDEDQSSTSDERFQPPTIELNGYAVDLE